jgi:uncharacterized membrane protein YhhN
MFKKYLKFNLLFVLIFTLQLIAEAWQITVLKQIVKPCIAISLLVLLASATSLKGRFHKRIFIGLIFGLAGDVFLLFASGKESYFIWGLFAFLIGHLYYTSAFYLDFRSAPELDKRGARFAIGTCAVLVIAFYLYLRPYLGHMKLPVMIYILVISMMVMMACFRNLRVNAFSFNLILTGAILFMISDAILAYNKFVQSFSVSQVVIMSTYMAAQYLIVIGASERKLLN